MVVWDGHSGHSRRDRLSDQLACRGNSRCTPLWYNSRTNIPRVQKWQVQNVETIDDGTTFLMLMNDEGEISMLESITLGDTDMDLENNELIQRIMTEIVDDGAEKDLHVYIRGDKIAHAWRE